MGDLSALEQVVAEALAALREPIYRYVFSAVGNSGDAEDIAQEAFIRLFRELLPAPRAWVDG